MQPRRDARSVKAKAYRRLYNTAQWKRRRANQLTAYPLCAMCKEEGRLTPATVADHDPPHKGDPDIFFHGHLVSLCSTHHDSTKQAQERGKPRPLIGSDGWPVETA